MREEVQTIALLEGHAVGRVSHDQLRQGLKDSEAYSNPEEAIALYQAALDAIKFSCLRKELAQISIEES